MGKTIISANRLSFQYKDTEEGIFDLNFNIEEGEFILLAGDSGSGKSTLIRCLNGLIPLLYEGKKEGELFIEGKDIFKKPMSELNKLVGSVFQNPRSQFFTTNSTAELVFAMENYAYTKAEMEARLEGLVGEFRLGELLDRDILSLSSGERQLLALACSLSLGPKIMLFDEPSANLDYANTMFLSSLLNKLKESGITVIVSDHRFYYLSGLVDRVFLFRQGYMEVYEGEGAFRHSDYDTRSFKLFEEAETAGFLSQRRSTEEGACAREIRPLIEIHKLSYKNILDEVNLDLYRNELTVLVGNNGAGKTTLAKLLVKSMKPDKGEIKQEALPLYIMQDADFQLFGSSVYGELKIAPHEIEDAKIIEALDKLKLGAYMDKHPFDLSGGQKQRLQIAMAMVSENHYVIFDEPTSGLDVKSMNRVAEEMDFIKQRAGIFVISHDYEFIRKVADRIVYLKNGRIVSDFKLNEQSIGTLNDIFKEMEENVR